MDITTITIVRAQEILNYYWEEYTYTMYLFVLECSNLLLVYKHWVHLKKIKLYHEFSIQNFTEIEPKQYIDIYYNHF